MYVYVYVYMHTCNDIIIIAIRDCSNFIVTHLAQTICIVISTWVRMSCDLGCEARSK